MSSVNHEILGTSKLSCLVLIQGLHSGSISLAFLIFPSSSLRLAVVEALISISAILSHSKQQVTQRIHLQTLVLVLVNKWVVLALRALILFVHSLSLLPCSSLRVRHFKGSLLHYYEWFVGRTFSRVHLLQKLGSWIQACFVCSVHLITSRRLLVWQDKVMMIGLMLSVLVVHIQWIYGVS